MKTKILYLGLSLLFFSFYSCCGLMGEARLTGWKEYTGPKTKHFTIINRTDKEYKNNFLASLSPAYLENDVTKKKWKLYYEQDWDNFHFNKITTIEPEGIVNKNDRDNVLQIGRAFLGGDFDGVGSDDLFLLSLDGGKRKVFFGAYHYRYERVLGEKKSDCTTEFIGYDVHPVWQEKELTITIEKDGKITFSDPKIKEAKKICLEALYDNDWNKKIGCKEEVDPKTLPLIKAE